MKFDLPWRIHWRLGHGAGEMAARVRDCRPLAVTLEIEEPDQLAPLQLPWEGTSVVVIHRGWGRAGREVRAGTARRWEFPVSGPGEARSLVASSFLGVPPAAAALRWFPRRGALRDLAALLGIAGSSGCGLTLPNRPAGVITSEGEGAFPGRGELTPEVVAELKLAAQVLAHDRLRIHDFILTDALGLRNLEPQGCEAANSMAFIDSDGRVYPCETLMVPLGDLNLDDLASIWASPVRVRLRRDVESMPGICSACPDLGHCRGGCRGAVFHLAGHYGATDPLCSLGAKDRHE